MSIAPLQIQTFNPSSVDQYQPAEDDWVFKNLFGIRVAKYLQDPEKAKKIEGVVEKHPNLLLLLKELDRSASGSNYPSFGRWLLMASKFVGSAQVDFWKLLKNYGKLDPRIIDDYECIGSYLFSYQIHELVDELILFFKDLQGCFKEEALCKTKEKTERVCVAILTSRFYGWGHYVVANALSSYLAKKGCKVFLIETTDVIKASLRHLYGAGKKKVVISSSNQVLRRCLRDFNPNLIISTLAFKPMYQKLAYELNRRFLVYYTDYGMIPELSRKKVSWNFAIESEDSNIVSYSLPAKDLQLKEPIQSIRFLGFPLREQCVPEKDQSKIDQIREKLQIQPGSQVVLVVNGSFDTICIIEYVEAIYDSRVEYTHPLHLVVVTQKNQHIETELRQVKKRKDIRLVIHENLDDEAISDYLKTTSRHASLPGVYIGKPGGASTAENLAMGVYMISPCVSKKKHETHNMDYFVDKGMGEELRFTATLGVQLKMALDYPSPSSYDPIDWKKSLDKEIQELRR